MQVRFHIMSERELREKKVATGNEANSQLNFQQLSKSLLTLLNLYGAVDAEGGSGWLHEAEFYGYYVLLNLGDRDNFKVGVLTQFLEMAHGCWDSVEVCSLLFLVMEFAREEALHLSWICG